ncbi:MAG: hypothetical protein OXE94_10825 [Aestuariivita sp.]|nr:hypothetical protein [Aestuariivita sp.]MCY4201729.1 hypothetical protein [Aestuariivita sp.]
MLYGGDAGFPRWCVEKGCGIPGETQCPIDRVCVLGGAAGQAEPARPVGFVGQGDLLGVERLMDAGGYAHAAIL